MSAKVLIVDDDPSNLVTLESMLRSEGYTLHTARDGEEAYLTAREVHPDVILLDVMMPRLDGFGACRRIRTDPVVGRVPILMLTALDDQESRLEGLRSGADDFLTKPCNREELRARVRTVVALNRFRMIAEQRERFQRLFAIAPDPIVLVDGAGLVVAANHRGQQLLVLPSGVPDGRLLTSLFAESARPTLEAMLADLAAGSEPEPARIRSGDGESRRLYVARGTVVPDQGTSLYMIVLSDVTAETEAREALEKLNHELDDQVCARTRQLQDANQLLLSYANFVSHDLRSPLAVVVGCLSIVVDDKRIPVEALRWIERSYNGAMNLSELITNILQLAQDEHHGTTSDQMVEPGPVIARLTERLGAMQRDPKPRFVIGPMPRLQVSAMLLERVFYNLVGNALKYSSHRPEPVVEVGALAPAENGNAVLFVRDNGVGFGPEEADRLFREFSRLSTAEGREGLGLGLSLVARLVQAHNGRIWAEGVPGVGATFFVELPLARPDPESPQSPADGS